MLWKIQKSTKHVMKTDKKEMGVEGKYMEISK
jgi:hypothetical protein